MIGLVDYDLQSSNSIYLHPPNLEIMKLATFYKIEEQQFCRLISLDEEELSAYEKIYFFSEADNPPQILSHFLRTNNIIFGGTAFTKGIYQPFQNELIDFTLAKSSIYKDYLKQCYQNGIKAKIISHILDDSYYRQFAGTNRLPLPPIKPNKKLWVYDVDFFQDGWQDWVKEAIERHCSSIGTIHPIICHKLSEYIAIRQINKIARANHIILDINVPLEEVHYMFKEYKSIFLEDISKNSAVFLKIGGDFQTNFQYYRDLIYKLNLLYSFWSNGIPIKLKYIPPHLGISCGITHLLQEIEVWARSSKTNWSINDKIIRKSTKHPKESYIEEQLILKFHPTAADLFKQNYDDLSTRRFWRI